MRRAVTVALTLGAACLLLFGCSETTDPTAPVSTSDTSADKRPPIIDDPPPGFDQYIYGLNARFSQISWVEKTVTFTVYDEKTTFYPEGHDPVDLKFTRDPSLIIPAGTDPPTFEATIWLPAKPGGGNPLFVPGDCLIFMTRDLPHEVYGEVSLELPIMDFYDQSDYTGRFTVYSIETNQYGFPGATNVREINVPDWTGPYPEVTVYMEIPEIRDKTDPPGDATAHAADPEDIGEEVD